MKRPVLSEWVSRVLIIVAPLISAATLAQTPTFNVLVLGNIPDGIVATVVGINNAGEAAGSVIDPTLCKEGCPVTWSGGTPTLLAAVPSSIGGYASSINNAGQVAGVITTSGSSNHAVVWSNGTPTPLPFPGAQYTEVNVGHINDAGEIAGGLVIKGKPGPPVVWNGLTPIILEILPGFTSGTASGINDNGLVIGTLCCSHSTLAAAVWHGTTPTLLPKFSATAGAQAIAVNNSGLVVGQAGVASATGQHAVAWTNGAIINLASFGGTGSTTALNNRGIIVGYARTPSNGQHAAIWGSIKSKGQDLNALISTTDAAEYTLTDATGINDSCAIVANGFNKKTFFNYAFLLTLNDPSACVNGGL